MKITSHQKEIVAMLTLIFLTMSVAAWRAVGGIRFSWELTQLEFVAWMIILTIEQVVLVLLLRRGWKRMSPTTQVALMLWGGVAVWYWSFAPLYYLMTMNLNSHQLAWTAFAFLWEVPAIGGGVFATVGLLMFLPIASGLRAPTKKSVERAYRNTLNFPARIAGLLFGLSIVGYVLGGVQLRYFAAISWFELAKSLANGPVVAIFLAVYYYLSLDVYLDKYRGQLSLHGSRTKPRRSLRKRLAYVSGAVMIGSTALLSLVVVQSFQSLEEDQVMVMLSEDAEVMREKIISGGDLDDEIRNLARGDNGRVSLLSTTELVEKNFGSTVRARMVTQDAGVVKDTHAPLKMIAFASDENKEKFLVSEVWLPEFYDFLDPQISVPYGLGVLLVLGLTMAVLLFVAITITVALRSLYELVQNPETGEMRELPGLHTADELELVGQTFLEYVHKTDRLKRRLRKQVERLDEERLLLDRARTRDQAILDSMGEGLIVTDQEERVVMMNKKAEELVGWSSNEVIGRTWHSVVKVTDAKGSLSFDGEPPLHTVLRTGRQASEDSFCYIRKDGSSFPVSLMATALVFKGETMGGVMVFQDITHAKEVERMKDDFVSIASHQLRTPLTAINWYLELLSTHEMGNMSNKQRQLIGRVEHNAGQMVKLVNNLLNIARVEGRRLSITPVLTDMKKFLTSIAHELRPQSEEAGCSVELVLPNENIYLEIDIQLLRQVIVNLLTNSFKYQSSQRHCLVQVEMEQRDGVLNIKVQDNGVAIPAAEQARIFEKFFRASNANSSHTEGSGLGLYVCKILMEAAGGTIEFISEEGRGTIFTISIPDSGMVSFPGDVSLAETG